MFTVDQSKVITQNTVA